MTLCDSRRRTLCTTLYICLLIRWIHTAQGCQQNVSCNQRTSQESQFVYYANKSRAKADLSYSWCVLLAFNLSTDVTVKQLASTRLLIWASPFEALKPKIISKCSLALLNVLRNSCQNSWREQKTADFKPSVNETMISLSGLVVGLPICALKPLESLTD